MEDVSGNMSGNGKGNGKAESMPLQKLQPYHRQIAYLIHQGVKPKKIAETLGLHYQSIVRIKNSPLFKAELNRLEMNTEEAVVDATTRLRALLPRAVDVLEEQLGDPENNKPPRALNDGALTKVALEVIDRAIPKKHEHEGPSVEVNIQQIIAQNQEKSDDQLIKDIMGRVRQK